MSLSNPCRNPYRNIYRRFFHESKKDVFLEKLKVNLEKDDLERLGPNSLTDKIILCIQDAINSTFPLKKVSRKEARKISNPWMTKEILSEIKNRDNLKKSWIKSGHVQNTPEHVAYKVSRNIVVKMTRIAKKTRFSE